MLQPPPSSSSSNKSSIQNHCRKHQMAKALIPKILTIWEKPINRYSTPSLNRVTGMFTFDQDFLFTKFSRNPRISEPLNLLTLALEPARPIVQIEKQYYNRAVRYREYRHASCCTSPDRTVSSHVFKMEKMQKLHFKSSLLNFSAPYSIFSFLVTLNLQQNTNSSSDGAAMWIHAILVKNTLSEMIFSRMSAPTHIAHVFASTITVNPTA